MGEMEELILCEVMNQTLLDNTATVSDDDLASMFQFSVDDVRNTIQQLIAKDFLLKLAVGRYTVKFDNF